MNLTKKQTDTDIILAYLQGEESVELSDELREKVQKIEITDRLLMQYKDHATVSKMLRKKWPAMHRTSTYRLIHEAQHLFGPIRKPAKDYARRMLIDDVWHKIKVLSKDDEAIKANAKLLAPLYKILVDAYGFKMQEADHINPDDLGQHQNILVIQVDTNKLATLDLNRYNNLTDDEITRLMDAFQPDITDAEFEDIMDE